MVPTPVADPRSFHVPAGPVPGDPTPTEPPVPAPRRRRWPWVVVVVVALLAVVPAWVGLRAWSSWRSVERVELEGILEGAAGGTNYLIVGTDSRAGVDPDAPNAGVIFGEGITGERTDTIGILRIDDGDVSLLAIPRDLYVDTGAGPTRINAAFARGGPAQLVTTVQDQLSIGIDHYLEVDFAGFLSLVDALGGVTIDFPHPARDPKSGLQVDTAGPVELDSDMALAYVRARNYIELVDGVERRDPTADLGRVERQQRFLAAVFASLGGTRNPFALLEALDGVSDNVVVDDTMGLGDALRLGWVLRGADPLTETVPTVPHTTSSGAQVLLLDPERAATVLEAFS